MEHKKTEDVVPLTREEMLADMQRFAEQNPDAPKPYFDIETREEMERERENKWARKDKIRRIKWIAVPILAGMVLFWLATSWIGVMMLPRVVTKPAMELRSSILLATRYRNDPQIDVLKLRGEHSRELEKEHVDRKRVAELEALMGAEEQKVDMRLREKYKDVKLGEIKQRSLARFAKASPLRDFYAENPNVEDLTVSEFYANANYDQKRKLHNLLLEFARHAGKE